MAIFYVWLSPPTVIQVAVRAFIVCCNNGVNNKRRNHVQVMQATFHKVGIDSGTLLPEPTMIFQYGNDNILVPKPEVPS